MSTLNTGPSSNGLLLARPRQLAQNARLKDLGLNLDSDLERYLGRRLVETLPDG
jgi:hypothetical protein